MKYDENDGSTAFFCRSLAVFHANVACQSCLMLPTPWVQMSTDAASESISGAYTRTGSAMTVSLLLSSLSSLPVQLKKKTLEVTVWDYDRSSSNDFLGEVSVFRTFKLSDALVFALFYPHLSSLMIQSFGKEIQIP